MKNTGNRADDSGHHLAPRYPTPLLGLEELADLLQLASQSPKAWFSAGRRPRAIKFPRLVRFDPIDVNDWAGQELIGAVPLSDFRPPHSGSDVAMSYGPLLNATELTTYLRVSRGAFERWHRTGLGPSPVSRLGPLRFTITAVTEWLEDIKRRDRDHRREDGAENHVDHPRPASGQASRSAVDLVLPDTGAGIRGLKATGQTVASLEGRSEGIWLVTTQGSEHLWNLDDLLYTRIPGAASLAGSFDYDRTAHRITRVERWPSVGGYSVVFFDDPRQPLLVEQWRASSTIRRIERVERQQRAG